MLPTLISHIMVFSYLGLVPTPPAVPQKQVLAEHRISLEDRYPNPFVNKVFKDNISLTVKDMGSDFTLEPGQTFAFHDDILPEYQGKVVKTTNAHFNFSEGFESDGYLAGDGVCHLASLMNWVAKDAHLDSLAPTNHNFANIPEINKKYGVAIYTAPGKSYSNERENLYITNNLDKPVEFKFTSDGDNLDLSILEDN